MKRRPDIWKILSAFIVISRCVLGLCFFLMYLDLVPVTCNGFGVDSAGRLYVGRGHHIEVWENGERINTIRKGTSRGHKITILEDDTILIVSGNHIMIVDLEGKAFLDSWEEENKEKYDELTDRRIFTAVTGERYAIGRLHGRLTVVQGETVIYQEPLLDCLLTWSFLISMPCVVISVPLERWMKRRSDPDWYPASRIKFDPPSRM